MSPTPPIPLHAVVLAGGPGIRIPPYSTPFPKPLVPLGGEHAVIEIVLRQLRHQGFTTITIAVGHLGALVQAYCGDGERWGVPIQYWSEDEALGTVGPIVAHADEVPEDLLVVNGDVLTDLDFRGLLEGHVGSGAPLTVATCRRTSVTDFGVLEVGGPDGDRVVTFREKPTDEVTVSTGVYALSTKVLGRYRAGRPLGFDELMIDLIERGELPRAVPFDGFWLDLGRAEEYARATAEWEQLAPFLLPVG